MHRNGLSLTKEFIELHKGQVKVSSASGTGSVFRVELPLGSKHMPPDQIDLTNEAAPVAGLLQDTEPVADFTAITGSEIQANLDLVLIIEDNLDLRHFLEVNLIPLRKLRLKRVANLHRQKSGNVAEEAYGVGFDNLSYFAKYFRAAYGNSPSK